ncbi:hypothetical protein FALBO_16376 [Fusarium albosuccineum]|uniref:Zn(2)-C6 fungal-type domain-containing protein n=1 Tax=Fusarium albosuccineum TaxID=1237068 RepID=A0A8H4KIS4_9HYPO|nr:hypothetical protein FALBO_16376 [Fusarium albosuccineum]
MPKSKPRQARGKPRGIRRDRDCRTCKLRGVKCDLNRPRCLPCVQSGLACGGYPQRVVWASEAFASTSKPTPDTRIEHHEQPRVLSSPTADLERTTDELDRNRALVEHTLATDQHNLIGRLLAFCRSLKTTRALPRSNSNEIQSLDVDQALGLISRVDEFLQARIQRHGSASYVPSPTSPSLVENTPFQPDSPENDTFEIHRLAALASLSEVLKTADPVAFLGIAVFAFFEVVSDGAFGEWDCHLRGARSLLDYHCSSLDELQSLSHRITGLTEIVAYFGWWDTVGVVLRHSTSRTRAKDRLIFDDWHRSILGDEFFNAVGCSSETFWLFVSLAKGEEQFDELDDQGQLLQAMSQLMKLGMDTTERGKCFDTYRCAAAIAVLTWQDPVDSNENTEPYKTTLASAVDRICRTIESASPCSRFYIHMATPAYLAAMRATSPWHCDILRSYWQNCQMGELPRYSGAGLQCEETWRHKGLV